jgi:hypothetical protein
MLAHTVSPPVARRARSRLLQPVPASACIILVSLAVSLAISAQGGVPPPLVHDEFSYLLAGDTFAHGRLCNPPHPLADHFESPHVLQWPSYASKYPPAQGLVLAAGQVLIGQPIAGVWLSSAAACLAVYWMLRGCVRPRWALLGGVLTALHPLMLVWSQGYWGGSVAACGGALVLGALWRMAARPSVGNSLLLAAGLVLLANSRPFEGLALCLVAGPVAFLRLLRGQESTFRRLIVRVIVPVAVVLLPAAVAMGYYNLRVTGSAFRLPYAVHEASYAVAPPFLWQAPRPDPNYHQAALRDLHVGWELPAYAEQRTLRGFLRGAVDKSATLLHAYFPLVFLAFAAMALLRLHRDRVAMCTVLVGLGFLMPLFSETWMHPHYAAPALALAVVLVVQGIRHLWLWRGHGRRIARMGVVLGLAAGLASLIQFGVQLAHSRAVGWQAERVRLLADLERAGGRHLVVVRYRPGHSPHAEWVYNAADIESAAVVWAHELGPARNGRLLDYFHDRQAWLLEADAPTPRLVPYPEHPRSLITLPLL